MKPKQNIYDLDLEELETALKDMGQAAFRGRQLFQALHVELIDSPEEITTFSKDLRRQVAEKFEFGSLTPKLTQHSKDGHTSKTMFVMPDGEAIETVLMRYRKRRTLCISTQAGCAMGCVFCATGQMGFRTNLTSGQIVEQVLYYARQLKAENDRPTNVVLMGMGEPFHNYDATMAAIDRLNHPKGINLGARRFTVSTVGLVPAIRRFTQENRQVNLAISLHDVDDKTRSAMLPINRRYPVDELLNACRDYVRDTGRRITFEWALIHDKNDSVDQAKQLAYKILDINCHVNIIPLNPTKGYSGVATTNDRARAFQEVLENSGIPCTIRLRRGIDISAGCGQLVVEASGLIDDDLEVRDAGP